MPPCGCAEKIGVSMIACMSALTVDALPPHTRSEGPVPALDVGSAGGSPTITL